MTKITEGTWIPLGNTLALAAVILGCTWSLGGRLASMDAKVDVIPKLESKVDALSTSVKDQDTKIQLMDQKVVNIQANAKLTVRQIKKMNQAQSVAGALNRGPFGFVN